MKVFKKKCDCGISEHCLSNLYVSDRGAMMRKLEEMFICGKVKSKIKKMAELSKKLRLRN